MENPRRSKNFEGRSKPIDEIRKPNQRVSEELDEFQRKIEENQGTTIKEHRRTSMKSGRKSKSFEGTR